MSIDMKLGDCWPESVRVEIEVYYASGPPDRKMFSVEPCPSMHAVRVFNLRPGCDSIEMHRFGWGDLPGRALYQRCLSVLALHWFGSIDMVPRVRGVPLWRSLSAELSMPSADVDRVKFDIHAVSDASATLRYQFRRDQPLVSGTVVLDPLDADPLRALLRVGLGRVKPMAAPRKVASKPTRRHLASQSDANVHASVQPA
ncbi:MAG: hypothetical protein Q7T97_09945 [Burkholderiaceae bacterium]|nr:hypothetical protein [Burkholderiaceae bacterium]